MYVDVSKECNFGYACTMYVRFRRWGNVELRTSCMQQIRVHKTWLHVVLYQKMLLRT